MVRTDAFRGSRVLYLCIALTSGCDEAEDDLVCNCPFGDVVITVQQDQAVAIESVEGSGAACSGAASEAGAGQYVLAVQGAGQCDVRVTFRNGKPDFVDHVLVAQCAGGGCCAACGPLPDHAVSVVFGDAG